MANVQRQRRVADQIQRTLADVIRLELRDPGIGMITLTDVEVSPDLAHAKVFYTVMGDEPARDSTQAALKRAAGFLRTMLGKQLKVHVTPELHFFYDASVESGMRLSKLIDEALAPAEKPPRRSTRAKPA